MSLTREQRLACNLALSAQTPGEVEAAHVLMIRAFPKLAQAYPCDCETCRLGRVPEHPLIADEERTADELYEDALARELADLEDDRG